MVSEMGGAEQIPLEEAILGTRARGIEVLIDEACVGTGKLANCGVVADREDVRALERDVYGEASSATHLGAEPA